MTETVVEPQMDIQIKAKSVDQVLAELEQRVRTLESRVATLPDARQIEEHVTERVKASIPPPPPRIDPSDSPTLRDIALPIPNAQAIVDTARTTWALFEMVQELKILFWTLVDRRYHMAWLTRVITISLLVMILTSQWWVPFASYENIVSRLWDKIIDIFLCLLLFMILIFEARRYKKWRGGS